MEDIFRIDQTRGRSPPVSYLTFLHFLRKEGSGNDYQSPSCVFVIVVNCIAFSLLVGLQSLKADPFEGFMTSQVRELFQVL